MSGVRVALDTVTAIHFLNDVERVIKRMAAEPGVGLPSAVAGELLFGALNSDRSSQNLARYEAFILSTVLLPADLETAHQYARVRLHLKQIGHPIPHHDMWIAASCLRHDLTLVTSDAHFAHCAGLPTEDWMQ
jgi:tRNA(fMet)-specific endonuclease VapC